jgi:hypothetical protein
MTIDTPTELSTLTGSWVLDPQRTTIEFQTKILWIFPVKGAFQARRGWGQLTADGFLTGALVIDTGSINTGITKRKQPSSQRRLLRCRQLPDDHLHSVTSYAHRHRPSRTPRKARHPRTRAPSDGVGTRRHQCWLAHRVDRGRHGPQRLGHLNFARPRQRTQPKKPGRHQRTLQQSLRRRYRTATTGLRCPGDCGGRRPYFESVAGPKNFALDRWVIMGNPRRSLIGRFVRSWMASDTRWKSVAY